MIFILNKLMKGTSLKPQNMDPLSITKKEKKSSHMTLLLLIKEKPKTFYLKKGENKKFTFE